MYSSTILTVLGAHEMGHYGVPAAPGRCDLPYFLPLPPPFFTGTLGAVIRIREAFPTKAILFDIGVAAHCRLSRAGPCPVRGIEYVHNRADSAGQHEPGLPGRAAAVPVGHPG